MGRFSLILMVCISAWVVVSYFLLMAISGSSELIVSAFMRPVCKLPLVPRAIPYCSQNSFNRHFSPDFLKLVSLQSRLEDVMDDSTSTSIIAVDMKNSEIAVRDLYVVAHLHHLALSDCCFPARR